MTGIPMSAWFSMLQPQDFPEQMSAKPRILILIPYANDIGFAIGRLLAAFHAAAIRVTGDSEGVHYCFSSLQGDVSSGLPPEFKQVVGYDVYRGSTHAIESLADYVRSQDITVVFALDLPVEARCLPALRRAGVRTVVSYWGAPMSSINHGMKLLAKRAEVRWIRPKRPDLFIFESRAMREFAVDGRGIPECDTAIVPTGVDIEKFRPRPVDHQIVYQTFNIPADRRIVVFMGHLHERKGVRVLLKAAEELVAKRHYSNLHFLFLGDRLGERERFEDVLGDAFRRGFISFGGYHSNIPELLAGCYMGCIPSTGWDSFPMSSLELQACGIPVVVSRLQGVPETIEEGVTGISVPAGDFEALADALKALSDDPELRALMSYQARERIVRELTTEHQVTRLAAALQSYCSRKSL